MRRLSLLIALCAIPALADDKPKPNTLTPKEIAEGWILLFDGETTFGWTVEGEAKVKDGELILGGDKETIATITSSFKYVRANATNRVGGQQGELKAVDEQLGAFGSEQSSTFTPSASFRIRDGRVEISVPAGKTAYLSNIRCRPTRMTTLFNGIDLSGWKEFKPTKDKKIASKFTVTEERWLKVKDGPGDLQTEGQWADFVVQVECISNGKHLNSGLFFRCIPNLYQQGYEAQIRNEWEGDDRTKPVDFGTGAIYRRQKARKVVSTDGEWFTMTVAAHGRHIATWVNGYQVTDWTDDRKENDNARNGFKKGKGALSIQGHDPTTDLSFRNIRIQSLDPK
jgi:hypothetical protein